MMLLTENEDGTFSYDGHVLSKVRDLSGRGQVGRKPGLSGFYLDSATQKTYLMKADLPEICLLEGSASFAKVLLPENYHACINFANAGSVLCLDKTQVAISIQSEVKNSMPWDVLLYGGKRNPSDFISIESRRQFEIVCGIHHMTDEAQTQLALAIYASTLVGDESLHTGQFMAILNESQQISGMVRIDLGARERYAVARSRRIDIGHSTSEVYKHSGQFGKNYLDFLLNHHGVSSLYLQLWMRDISKEKHEELLKACAKEFSDQLDQLSDTDKKEALSNMLQTLSNKSNSVIRVQDDPIELTEQIITLLQCIVANRILVMKEKAKLKVSDILNSHMDKLNINDDMRRDIEKIVFTRDLCVDKNDVVVDHFLAILEANPVMNALSIGVVFSHMISALECRLLDTSVVDDGYSDLKLEIQRLKSIKVKFDIIEELLVYQSYLTSSKNAIRSFLFYPQLNEEKKAIVQAEIDILKMKATRVSDQAWQPFFDAISIHRISGDTPSKGEALALRLKCYLEKYDSYVGVVKPFHALTQA